MCGIAGYYGNGNKDVLEKMTASLKRRGPDDEGCFITEKAGLGHRRLSIIDLSSAGHQPMSNEDGTVWIAFNGEIYNFQELRSALGRRHGFRSNTDTETILHLYEEVGTRVFAMIHGMFAIAIYDANQESVFLARDRLGKKPLYWSLRGDTLIFGSELKALVQHPDFRKAIDYASLNKYFLFGYVPTPDCIFKDTKKLEPATWLSFDGKEVRKFRYWEPAAENPLGSENSKNKLTDNLQELDRRLSNAVAVRLVSDAPLGVFLSGGIDSSTIAYYAQKLSPNKIKTFSIGFKEDSFDESRYARMISTRLNTEHYERIFSEDDCLELIPEIAEMADEPLADGSILPTCLLSRFTKERVTVALGGDGSDELFCGYDTFIAHKIASFYEKIPQAIRNGIIRPAVLGLPTSFSNISLDFKAKRFVSGFDGDPAYRDARWMAAFSDQERLALFAPWIRSELAGLDAYENVDSYIGARGSGDKYGILTLLYLRMYMMDQVLVKVDRSSMHNSLEVRAPFLDTSVVEFALRLPTEAKFNGFTVKYILKRLMDGKLPSEVVWRKKKGFGMPVSKWLNGPLKPLVDDFLSRRRIEDQGLFSFDIIDKLLKEHACGKKDNRLHIWPLLVFELWLERWKPEL